jgi:hypothetical protein
LGEFIGFYQELFEMQVAELDLALAVELCLTSLRKIVEEGRPICDVAYI